MSPGGQELLSLLVLPTPLHLQQRIQPFRMQLPEMHQFLFQVLLLSLILSGRTADGEGYPDYEDRSLQLPLLLFSCPRLPGHTRFSVQPVQFSYHFLSAAYKVFRALP